MYLGLFVACRVFYIVSHVLCGICFAGSSKKHMKRSNIEEIKDLAKFKMFAINWMQYEHEYSSVYNKHDWSSIEVSKKRLYAHKNCKGKFLKHIFMSGQKLKNIETEMDVDIISSNTTEAEDIIEDKNVVHPRRNRSLIVK